MKKKVKGQTRKKWYKLVFSPLSWQDLGEILLMCHPLLAKDKATLTSWTTHADSNNSIFRWDTNLKIKIFLKN
jgi:hypothetical protein